MQAITKPSAARLQTPLAIQLLAFAAVAGVLAGVWGWLAPARLFDFDAANFALALDYFQPAAHQPQPPGYPLYVALTKFIHLFVADVAFTFLIAGLLGAAAAVIMLWILGERMFGRHAGILSALLFLTNPILWQTGMSDQVRIYIAVISVGVALAVWPIYTDAPSPARRLAASSLLLGFLSGFRPEMAVSMAPLLLMAALHRRMSFRQYLVSAFALCAGMAPWLIMLLVRVGGFPGFMAMMRVYSAEQASGSSVLFGAGWGAAWKMFVAGLWWASLGVVSWLPAAFLVPWRKVPGGQRRAAYFLLAWFLSLFVFSIAVHIAASGHALGFIPVLCLAGGWVLSAVGRTSGVLMLLCTLVAVSLNIYFFFKPYSREVREASFQNVAGIGDVNDAALERIDSVTQQHAAFLVSDDAWVSWRILQYYYPKSSLLYIPRPLAPTDPALPVWLIRNRLRVRDFDPHAELPLPSCGTILWLITDDRSKESLLAIKGAEDHQYFVSVPAQPGMHFRVGRYRLSTSSQPCTAAH